jgi:hypothetical protein
MKGLTITEMATELGLAPNAVMQRLYVAGIKPISKEAIYDPSALEAIRNVPGKGRPKKVTDQEPAKPTASKPRAAKQPVKAKR